jgi:2-polyprenyl-3-methyl-5-hydroxy-6-metoxy-1,4-benzoquinol methylase
MPAGLQGQFDFIYNGSVLDNAFDSAAYVRNVSRMLKPEGVAFHYEGAQHAAPA